MKRVDAVLRGGLQKPPLASALSAEIQIRQNLVAMKGLIYLSDLGGLS